MAENAPVPPPGAADEEFLPGYPDVVSFTQACFGKLVKATQKAHGLPIPGDDFEFYSSFPDFRDFCKSQGNRMVNNIGRVMKFQHVKCGWPSDLDGESSLETDDLLESMIEANDALLEQVDSCLDEASGLRKNRKPVLPPSMQQGNPVVSSWNKSSRSGTQQEDNKLRFLHAKNILRPQLKFNDKPDNSNVPFIPIIKEKPNALKPLEEYGTVEMDFSGDPGVPTALANFIHQQRIHDRSTECQLSTAHPYQYELEEFQPDGEDMNSKEEQMYKPFDETDFVFVDSVEKLSLLVTVLKGVKEFAVDLEHHSFRSFQGFVCLMQISTRDEDYLIDTIELRSDLPVFNEVFTDPRILKVFHGADMDVEWLQRDFGIYVVNMFDTGQAARVLAYPRFSLAFLLKKFCDVTANKQYQLADWRIRPLPSEMVRYAREDTHYLLYVGDRLRNELIARGNAQKNLVQSVYQRSKEVCLRTYRKPIFTSESYLALYHRHKKSLSRNQLEAFRLLHAWRDAIARLEDESCAYVLPNHMLFGIAEVLPKASEGVLACCNPVPTLVRQNINEIHRLVVQARDLDPKLISGPASTPSRSDPTGSRRASDSAVGMDTREATASDVKGLEDEDANVKCKPMTPFKNYPVNGRPPVLIAEPTIRLFLCDEETKEASEGEKKANAIRDSFKNPFQAFLPAKRPEEVAGKKSSEEINRQWKTKSEGAKRAGGSGEGTTNDEDKTKKKRRRDDGRSENEEDHVDGEEVSVRQRKKNKKKEEERNKGNKSDGTRRDKSGGEVATEDGEEETKKRRSRDGSSEEEQEHIDDDDEEVTLRQGKKNKKKKEKNNVKGNKYLENDDKGDASVSQGDGKFVPFDYSSAGLNFEAKNGGAAGRKRDVFNPYEKLNEKAKRFGSKVHMKSGERSMTFGKKK